MPSPIFSLLPEARQELSDAVAALPHGRLPCHETDPFGTKEQVRRLIAQGCPVCPVLDLCLEAGIGEREGVWGGYDRSERPKRPPSKRRRKRRSPKTQSNN